MRNSRKRKGPPQGRARPAAGRRAAAVLRGASGGVRLAGDSCGCPDLVVPRAGAVGGLCLDLVVPRTGAVGGLCLDLVVPRTGAVSGLRLDLVVPRAGAVGGLGLDLVVPWAGA